MEISKELPPTLDSIVKFLNSLVIKTEVYKPKEVGFDRDIKFTINGFDYLITWHINESLLQGLINNNVIFTIPFKYVETDTSYPHSGKWIKFSYIKYKTQSMWDREYPWELFRIKIN